jgi:hypothetical protein
VTAGLSAIYRLGDPLNIRMTGIVINQPDLPHWAVDILQWLGMVNAIQQATGDLGRIYRGQLEVAFEKGIPMRYDHKKSGKVSWYSGPASVYAVYQSFCAAIELAANK